MNFFERQRAARGTTLRLVLLFVTAVVAIVVAVDAVVFVATRPRSLSSITGLLIGVTVVTVAIIAGGTISKTIALRAGGSAVALSTGAVPVDTTATDPALRRYANIVEEMSLAAGVPVPRLFVLEREDGINAFAAGFTPADAAITVTGGALHQLNRDELQGVIGHEFSHILNGDMRLNIRLIGLLNGILLLGLVGLRVLAFGGGGGRRDDRGGGGAPILLIALAMLILGFVGQFFASLIKAAVSRQREWLADASAVQFTRQTTGLEGALKKIAGVPTGSALRDKRSAQEVSHMLFGEGLRSVSDLFATHPPLVKRITALDPSFQPQQLAQLAEQWSQLSPDGLAEDARAGLVAGTPTTPPPVQTAARVTPAQVTARVGTFAPQDVAQGAALAGSIPPRVRQLAGQPSTAVPLLVALLIDTDERVRAGQLAAVSAALGVEVARAVQECAADVAGLPEMLRLPVVSIATPTVLARPREQLHRLLSVLDVLARADGQITVFEYCLTRLVAGYVADADAPPRRSRSGRGDLAQMREATVSLLAALAAAGSRDPTAAAHAFAAATAQLFPGSALPYRPPADLPAALDGAWPVLDTLQPRDKQRLIEAMVAAVLDDGILAPAEAELLRTASALLHCPLPALLSPPEGRSLNS